MCSHHGNPLNGAALILVLLALLGVAGPLQVTALAQEVRPGEGEFRAWCSRCHGLEGRGDGPIAKELETAPPDLTALSKGNDGRFPANRVRQSIDGRGLTKEHGSRQMPSWGDWFSFELTAGGLLRTNRAKTEAEIAARVERITGYLKSLQK